MNLQKTVKVLASGFIAVTLLAACGSNSTSKSSETSTKAKDTTKTAQTAEVKPEDGAKLTVWYDDGDKGWATSIANQFTKKYGVKVTLQQVASTDAPAKMEKDASAGIGADVFVAPHDHTGEMASQGILYQNMDPDYYKKNDISAAVTGVSTNDKDGKYTMYGYPLSVETYALFYNKELMKKEGITSVPTTWTELFADAKKFNDDTSVSGKHYGFMMDVGNEYYMQSFLSAYGGYVFGKNNTDPTDLGLSGAPAAKTADFVNQMHAILPLNQSSITSNVMTSMFDTNKLMFYVDGPWAIAGHTQNKVNFGVATLPKLDNGKYPQTFSGIKALYVNAYTKYPKAAYLYAKLASSPDALALRYKDDSQIPVANSLINSSDIKSNPNVQAILKQAQLSAVPMPNIPQMQAVWTPMGTAFVTAWNKPDGKVPFEKAEAQIQTAIKAETK
ncbi:maltose ABC transporter substrate-binding protein [Pullulanibacillus sp. KACC 23026]|uniref:sugar ABC transporter substrate-binding protein n=1 Tax=Pullulanibacillus sp. KACC 23026 TaxID=3028315 RepID=UPI0023B16287|nr:maltose ABC transporter substrate-binding protein [Pullulanibacillus sp. KACC 23026]WEG13180.1 maltose ABC transporter substrate-binding protein [Pullulanibacillus sp. KACC 23026]